MSIGMAIQWLALGLCVVFAVMRLPEAIRGRGRAIFAVLVLLCVAVALSLSPIYLVVDGSLGGANIANLIIRFSLYAIMLMLGVRGAAAFGSGRALRFIRGPVGIAALAVTVAATVILFLLSDLPESSTGLRAYADQTTVHWYSHLGRLYPAYIAACLIGPATARVRDSATLGLHRVGAALMASAFAMVLAHAALNLAGVRTGTADLVLPFGAIVLVTIGLTLFWLSRRRAGRTQTGNFLAGEHRRP
jgi:hypothetical protein